jgi:hypothetical protein
VKTLARRLSLGLGVAALGLGWCLVNDHYWPEYRVGFVNDLILAFPFYVLGVAAILGRPRLVGTVLATAAIAALESFAFEANATSASSTASLAFLVPLFYGTALVVVAVLAQVLVDAMSQRRSRQFVAKLSEDEQIEWAEFMSRGHER